MDSSEIPALIDTLERAYCQSVEALRADVAATVAGGGAPDPARRAAGAYGYPELGLHFVAERDRGGRRPRAYRRNVALGAYRTTITRPALFRRYLTEQLAALAEDYVFEAQVSRSSVEIPFPYVIDGLDLDGAAPADLHALFPTTELALIGDEIADGEWVTGSADPAPLALFDGLRTDFSLARLRHYTGTPVEHFQHYVLFTNYHRYVDAFVAWGAQRLAEGGPYCALSCAGGQVYRAAVDPEQAIADGAWRRHQMPAYHLMTERGDGITLVNIGVGPSNAKTITDHLAVLRPEAWLMIGHCGGLRPSQRIGDYVLAHAYLRDDHVLDAVMPPEIPVPPIAEVQLALQEAAERVTREDRATLKQRLRTGTVVTSDDRNWELRFSHSALRFNQSRAIAIDMESATLAAQGQRFRVPHGTLLCVSDKPLHGEIKLPGQANSFYQRAIGEHIAIGIEAVDRLRAAGPRLHSRKLRAFSETPFR